MRSATENEPVVAACVTPPAAGGVAIIQVVGADLAGVLEPIVRSRRPLSIERFDPSELRLCRIVDGDQVIDDVLLAVRRSAEHLLVADLNLHGGPRIVQRVLLLLQRQGARIVDPGELPVSPWATSSGVERELLALLPRAATRGVARWLVAGVPRLESALRQVLAAIDAGHLHEAREALWAVIPPPAFSRYLLDGVRVAVIGEPNVGKSTLVNALAGRDHAIVSDVPGTTRDWVEHAGAIDGLPFTFIDTAGVRPTTDPIEAEAIRRAEEQSAQADLVLRVLDRSAPMPPAVDDAGRSARPQIEVLNKYDLPPHPSHGLSAAADSEPGLPGSSNTVMVSAVTGAGLRQLSERMLEAAGLTGWHERYFLLPHLCRESAAAALSALEREDAAAARMLLGELLAPDGAPSRGV